jgi:16S rRNA (uracil1498-N3)-methyltransferase
VTRRRWIADEVSGNTAALTSSNAQHLTRVLRAKVGQQFDIAAQGIVRLGTITKIAGDRVEFALGAEIPGLDLPEIRLLLAVFKFDRFEWAIEKATELGVARVIPLLAARTEAHLAKAAAQRAERWRRIAHEAAQQSRRAAEPAIEVPILLGQALKDSSHHHSRIVLAEAEKESYLENALQDAVPPIALAVGPEGGWTNEEVSAFTSAGWRTASLGSTILRAETAAIAALAIAFSTLRGEEK